MRVLFPVLMVIAGVLVPEVRALEVSGELTGTHLWQMADAADTVRVTGNVYIRDGASVTVAPGTVVRGYNGAGFLWRYNVFVEGTGNIALHGTPDSVIAFRNVCLEFGQLAPGGITGISYCSFSDGWGNASLEFRNASTPAGTGDITEMLIEDCSFTSGSYCLSYITSGARPTFRRCTFAGSDGAGIFVHGGGDAVIESCIFNGLSAAVCCAGMGSTPQWWEPVSVRLDHCTFYDINERNAGFTTVPAANGYGITTLNYPGSLFVRNSIFQDIGYSGIRDLNIENADTGDAWHIESDYNMYYDLGDDPVRLLPMGAHSQEADPLLMNAAGGDFGLRNGSPALNAADDGLNLGAIQNVPASLASGHRSGMAAPAAGISIRPVAGGTEFGIAGRLTGDLVVFNASGNIVTRLAVNGRHTVRWTAPAAAGMYYVRFSTDPSGRVRRFVRL